MEELNKHSDINLHSTDVIDSLSLPFSELVLYDSNNVKNSKNSSSSDCLASSSYFENTK